jgi:hypothetical protein
LVGGATGSLVVDASFSGDSVALAFDVRFTGSSADFTLDLSEFDVQNVLVFHGSENVTVRAGENAVITGPTLAYAGPDAQVQSLHISPSSLVLNATSSGSLSVTGTGANGQTIPSVRVGWTSRDPTVATVDSIGSVHAGVFQGSTYIVARTATNIADSALVKVHAPVAKVIVSPATLKLAHGLTGTLSAQLQDAGGHVIDDRVPTWSTSDATIATVSSQGAVQGVNIGAATITASAEGKTGTAAVSVGSPVDHIVLTPNPLTFASLRQKQTIVAQLVPIPGASVAGITPTFTSSNANVVFVDTSGVVTSASNGTATITVAADGVTATAPVTVKQIATSMTISPKTATVCIYGYYVGCANVKTATFTAKAPDSLGTQLAPSLITWTSDNQVPQVCFVSGGIASAVFTPAPGATATCAITASANGKSDTATLSIFNDQNYGRIVPIGTQPYLVRRPPRP